jgi:RecA-family ATPase
MRLLELEKAYLSCLLNGADPRDVVLKNELFEKMHQEIKRLKDKGFVLIPKKQVEGAAKIDYDENPISIDYYYDELLEEHKRYEIKGLAETYTKNSLPSDMQISGLKAELDRIAEKNGRMDIINTNELQNRDFQNTEFIVDKLLPVGLTILMGAPKKGKSWLLLLLADTITNGISIFGMKAQKAPVLYFTLEDSVKRCKYRLGKLKDRSIPWNKNFYFCEKAKGNSDIVKGIKETGARVVIIDTIGVFLTDIKDGNDYFETTRIIRQIKDIADNYQVSIILVTHTKKNESENSDWTSGIMGSQGWVGAADSLLRLDRNKNKPEEGTLSITGRDIPDSYLHLIFNDGYWELNHDKQNEHAKN